jgi:hypothetical protein
MKGYPVPQVKFKPPGNDLPQFALRYDPTPYLAAIRGLSVGSRVRLINGQAKVATAT